MKRRLQRNENVYDILESDLRKGLCSGRVDYAKPIVGELELAKRYGISRESARKAIAKLVADGYLERIRGKGTYVIPPERREKAGKKGKPQFSILIVEPFVNQAFDEYKDSFLESLGGYCLMNGVNAVYSESNLDSGEIIRRHAEGSINGVLWSRPRKREHEALLQISNAGVPIATTNRHVPGIPCIAPDFDAELSASIGILRDLGHKDIAFVNAASEELPYVERREAYMKRMTSGRLYVEASIKDGMDAQLAELAAKRPTAMIIGGHALFDKTASFLERSGLRMREDISVICLNDSPGARAHVPPVTVFTEDRAAIGVRCIETLRLAASGQKPPEEFAKLKGELIWRASCGPLKP